MMPILRRAFMATVAVGSISYIPLAEAVDGLRAAAALLGQGRTFDLCQSSSVESVVRTVTEPTRRDIMTMSRRTLLATALVLAPMMVIAQTTPPLTAEQMAYYGKPFQDARFAGFARTANDFEIQSA